MKKYLVGAFLLVGVQASIAHAGVNWDFNFGNNPAPVVVTQTQPSAPQFYINETPQFIFTPALGFYISVGSQYDIVYVRRSYYIYNDANWFRATNVDGPWTMISWRVLPPELHKHKLDEISYYRNNENRIFENDHENYNGRWHHTPDRRREYRREVRHDERRDDRHDDRRDEHRND